MAHGQSALRKPSFFFGVWRKPKISAKCAFVYGERIRPLRENPVPNFKRKKSMDKAKAAHDPVTIHKKLAKFPDQILAEKRDYLMQRLEDKQGTGWFQLNWQEKLAREKRAAYLRFNSIRAGDEIGLRRADEIRRVRLLQLLAAKPGQLVGT